MWWLYLIIAAAVLYGIRRLLVQASYYSVNPKGKAFLVTGAASGFGRATAEDILTRGGFVFACDINEKLLAEVYGKTANVRTIKMNVTSQEDVDNAAAIVRKEGKGLYGIVNSAGIVFSPGYEVHKPRSVAELDVDTQIKPVLEVNLFGTMRVNRAFIDELLESKGCIVNIASVAGIVPIPMLGAYVASKHGVVGYSACLRRELMESGVKVVCIQPGFSATPLLFSLVTGDFDYKVSKLKYIKNLTTFGNVEARAKKVQGMQSIDSVGKIIARCVLTSPNYEPHVVVDHFPERMIWRALRMLPWEVTDYVLTKLLILF